MLYSQSLVLNCARLTIDAMYNNFIMDRIHARNCRPCLAQNGGGGRTIPNGKEEGGRTSFIGRLMPLEIRVNCAIVYSLNTIPLCYKCMMQASENFTLGRSLYKTLRSSNATFPKQYASPTQTVRQR